TADHAASYNTMYNNDKKENGGYLFTRQIQRNLNKVLSSVFGSDKLVRSLLNYQVHLNYPLIDSLNLDLKKVKEIIIEQLHKEDGIAYAIDMEGSQNMFIPAPIREKVIKGYHRKNSGAIQINAEPQWYSGTPRSTGTTHGVWSSYDSHIPLIFMG